MFLRILICNYKYLKLQFNYNNVLTKLKKYAKLLKKLIYLYFIIFIYFIKIKIKIY
jgi:hypothetical protein